MNTHKRFLEQVNLPEQIAEAFAHGITVEALDKADGLLDSAWSEALEAWRAAIPCPSWCQSHELNEFSEQADHTHQRTISDGVRIYATDYFRTGDRADAEIVCDGGDPMTPAQARKLAQALLHACDLIANEME